MRNVDYGPLWTKYMLLWAAFFLLWVMAGGSLLIRRSSGAIIFTLSMLATIYLCILMRRHYDDEVAEKRFINRQCHECGRALHESFKQCPECGTEA